MHNSDFECHCGRQFFVGGFPGRYHCRTCDRDIDFGDFTEIDPDPKLVERVDRVNRARDWGVRRRRIKKALLTKANDAEQLGDLVARFSTESTSPKLRAYLLGWLNECGCQLAVAIANINAIWTAD